MGEHSFIGFPKKIVGCLAPKGHKTIGKRQSREPTDNYNFVE
jgi:hypothetical protein